MSEENLSFDNIIFLKDCTFQIINISNKICQCWADATFKSSYKTTLFLHHILGRR
jgi:hypothetical protein